MAINHKTLCNEVFLMAASIIIQIQKIVIQANEIWEMSIPVSIFAIISFGFLSWLFS